ncbi:hypothetical protein ACH4FX_26070 [Streptomyces sp. NPDC018019]|uniref:hypothetical protein n=1 Tax=Streptomyces sp. NPDC018019 TaxID=3365030 RepID=UPI0037B64DA9
MRFGKRTAGIAVGLASVIGLANAGPAMAATTGAQAVHRGSVGCFNYSYGDGSITWTVYYSNTCNSAQSFWVKTGPTSLFETCIPVKAKGSGSKVFYNKPTNFGSRKSC